MTFSGICVFRIFLLAILLNIFSSCVSEINLAPDQDPNLSVISGMICPGKPSAIYLNRAVPVLSQDMVPLGEIGFDLFQDDQPLLSWDKISPETLWLTSDLIREGHRYSIQITLADGTLLSASDSVPRVVPIKSAFGYKGLTYDEYGDPHYDFEVTIQDPPDVENYYELAFIKKREEASHSRYYFKSIVEAADPIIRAEGLLDLNPISFVFSDHLIDGEHYTIRMKFIGGTAGGTDIPLVKGKDGWYALLRSVSKNYYEFRKSWILHRRSQNRGDFEEEMISIFLIPDPVSLYTNIENGKGIFAAYTEDYRFIELH